MRIASLLPSATEIVCAIGLEDELVAVTHECDFPPSVMGRPVVTRNVFDQVGAGSRDIHDRVTAAMHGGSSIYELDEDALAAAEPDLVLTQELCRVCAVSYEDVNEAVRRIDADITVVSLEPTSIEGILNTISTIGAMTEAEDAAVDLIGSLRERLSVIETRVAERRAAGHRAPRVVAVEWLDPPFAVGHWVPEQIRRAGGWDLLGIDGGKALETTWDAVAEVDPEMLFLMPCGFHLADTIAEWGRTRLPPWVADIPAVSRGTIIALDGSSYYSRPGPRVIDGIELLAEVMDPEGFRDIAPPDGWSPVGLP
jgi:iron complex transport system substrate-binding protein